MEQFYEITPQSKRFAECMTYWDESDKQSEKVKKFMSNHNIPSPAIWRGNILYIKKRPDMSDDNFMKKTSSLGKQLKTLGFRRIFKPFALLFFEETILQARARLFPADGKVYCSVEHNLEKPLTCPEGFIEMKGSAFYEIMEGEEDA